jgi:hypothetical protein
VSESLEEDILTLDHKVSQLKREYEQYFLGTRPREPVLLRGEAQKLMVMLSNQAIQNTALRFKFASVCSRYQAYKRQWEEVLRKIEAGTYERHQFKAHLHGMRAPARAGNGRAAAESAPDTDLYQAYVDARLACGESVKGLTRDKLDGVIAKQRAKLSQRFGTDKDFQFRVAVEDGKVRLKASRASGD